MNTNASNRYITWKSASIALFCVIGIAVAGCYSAFLRYDLIGTGHLPRAAIWPIMVLSLINAIVKWRRGHYWLSKGELLFIYCIILVTCAIPGQQFATYWYLGLVGPIYYATPQNRYQEFFFHYLRPWLFPSKSPDADVVRWCFEAMPENKWRSWSFLGLHGKMVPPDIWKLWVGPIIVWLPLILGIFFLTICLSALLKRQWVEREQLLFPLAEVPLEITDISDEDDMLSAPIWRNGLMWTFFLIPTFIYTKKALHYYYPNIADINLYPTTENLFSTRPWNALNYQPMFYYFDMMGITYLLTTEMGFSLWFFYALRLMLMVARNGMGMARTNDFLQYNTIGGFGILVLFYLYTMRHHLRDVLVKALTNAPGIDDSDEPISYRFAFWGGIIGSVVLFGWCHAIGMSLWVCAALFGFYFSAVFVLSRMVSETGLFVFWFPLPPQNMVMETFTSKLVGPRDITTMNLVGWKIQDAASNICPNALQAHKVAHESKMEQRKLFAAMAIAIVVAVLACDIPSIHIIYKTTVPHMGWWPQGAARALPNQIMDMMIRPQGMDGNQVRWIGTGGLFCAFLLYMRQRFLWWPFHPLGFVATFYGGVGSRYGYSIFLGWLAKMIVLWVGGTRAWRKCRPAAIGLILGNCFVLFTWLLIQNFLFPIQGVLVVE